jgi:hypothetical protein
MELRRLQRRPPSPPHRRLHRLPRQSPHILLPTAPTAPSPSSTRLFKRKMNSQQKKHRPPPRPRARNRRPHLQHPSLATSDSSPQSRIRLPDPDFLSRPRKSLLPLNASPFSSPRISGSPIISRHNVIHSAAPVGSVSLADLVVTIAANAEASSAAPVRRRRPSSSIRLVKTSSSPHSDTISPTFPLSSHAYVTHATLPSMASAAHPSSPSTPPSPPPTSLTSSTRPLP